ncbi:acylphosphatase [Neobacillus piezotolerans]|uniref:acylphosphatase n=1 Tax=Neobacillus piezotolerans TaxID=2259171 RepID=A0A3D8GRP7_9BACI|nr:acylphosphatase [Neobacillus piezotolerans]RDU37150.1 acylphosphatase [Neobacillus piezotolerans]
MKVLKKLRDGYVIRHANNVKLPQFPSGNRIRKRIVFSGRVQKVGFRLELFRIAERLDLTGWVKNLEDGSVEAELQGEESKIQFLVNCMQSLKRASVKKVNIIDVPVNEDEENFTIVR